MLKTTTSSARIPHSRVHGPVNSNFSAANGNFNRTFHLSKFPSAALSSISVATATLHSSALQAENLSCVKRTGN